VSSYFRFELAHGCNNILGLWLDVIAKRDVDVRVAKYGLNYFIGNSKPIEIGSQATACRVPTVPYRHSLVAFIFVFLLQVLLAVVQTTVLAAI